MAEGIEVRVGKDGSKSYRASVWSNRDRKRIRKTFTSAAEAKAWRADALVALDKGALRAPKPITVRQAWEAWYEGAKAWTIRNRSGEVYKPSAIRSYERSMRLRVLPEFAEVRLSELRRIDVQDFVDKLLANGLDPSTINTTLHPLRAIYRRAMSRGDLAVNPTSGLDLPAARGRRERFATPQEAEALIEALPVESRAAWATMFYAGLRRGELQALRVEDIDLAGGVIDVRRGWDRDEGEIELKSHAGRRRVPIPAVLRDYLTEHVARIGRTTGLMFGKTASDPFDPGGLQRHADEAWGAANARERHAAEQEGRKPNLLRRVTPHEARHSYAAMMIGAGVNPKALQTFMGHHSITVTLDTYGHLMPGSEAEAAELVESYLTAQQGRAEVKARAADGTTAGQ